MVFVIWFGIIVSAGLLATTIFATWHQLPRGNLNSASVKATANMTKGLHSEKASGKVFYWLPPVFLLLFTSWVVGLVWLTTCVIGASVFVPRYNTALAQATCDS